MKKALVTVGTTKFEDLVRAVDSPAFAHALQKIGVRELIIQTGTGSYLPRNLVPDGQEAEAGSLCVRHLKFTRNLPELMASCSLIISHAGSGSIFEALTCTPTTTSLIVVPNPSLMDNHQAELSEHLAALGHLVCATPCTESLVGAVSSLPSVRKPFDKGMAVGIARHIDSVVLSS